jgi:hypothetical protein
MVKNVTQKTLGDILEILLAKRSAWNVDTNLKIMVGGTEIGSIAVTRKIEYVPQEGKIEERNAK